MKKILYITTVGRTINAFLIPHINKLIDDGNIVDCACSIEKDIDNINISANINVYNIPFNRNPLHLSNLKAFKKLIEIQKENKYDIVHVHTPVASVYGRLLKVKFPNLKTIYTVHGFHFHKGASLTNWAIYYPIERIMSKLTDVMITMNSEDYERAKKFNANEVYKVNGVGIDLNKYSLDKINIKETKINLGIKEDDFIILMIAEVNKNKNHRQMINALENIKKRGISNVKVICAGDGNMFGEIVDYVKSKKLEENVKMLGFRKDIKELISICDIGILMSYREGLPRNIMELMALGKPIIGTNIRGIRDLIRDNFNGYLVDIDDYNTTSEKIEYFYNHKDKISEMGNNSLSIISEYDIRKILDELRKVY